MWWRRVEGGAGLTLVLILGAERTRGRGRGTQVGPRRRRQAPRDVLAVIGIRRVVVAVLGLRPPQIGAQPDARREHAARVEPERRPARSGGLIRVHRLAPALGGEMVHPVAVARPETGVEAGIRGQA